MNQRIAALALAKTIEHLAEKNLMIPMRENPLF